MNSNLTIFDFDGTLIKGDSFLVFARLVAPKYSGLLIVYALAILAKVKFITNRQFKEIIVNNYWIRLSDKEKSDIYSQMLDFMRNNSRTFLFDKINTIIDEGEIVLILSASLGIYLIPFMGNMAPEAHVCASMVNIINGHVNIMNLYREEKIQIVRKYKFEFTPANITFYTDSYNDIFVTNECDITYLVNASRSTLNKFLKNTNKKVFALQVKN